MLIRECHRSKGTSTDKGSDNYNKLSIVSFRRGAELAHAYTNGSVIGNRNGVRLHKDSCNHSNLQ